MKYLYNLFVISILIYLTSCATYYDINREFNTKFERGQLKEAEQVLAKKKKKVENSKERLLYFLNRGVVLSLMGEYRESNEYLEKAYLYTEDYRVNYLNEAGALLSNPTFTAYRGEDHENLMVLYYKALNFMKLGEYDNALVECRRLNIRLDQLSDKYKSEKKYQKDAFIHTLMGIIYDAKKDYNNAFIAYRNALEIYRNDYQPMFGISAPDQLKEDILRTAYMTGFTDEFLLFRKEFGMEDYKYEPHEGGNLVFFWNNGLGPVKSEWSINFAVVHGAGGMVNFTNEEYGFNFPFAVPYNEREQSSSLKDLEFFRVAFPKYRERSEFFDKGTLEVGGRNYKLELAEDVNAIAFRSLKERMLKEFGKTLLRVALKKAAEHGARSEDEGLGAAVGFLNALTEKADTRNWQTLPHSIYYTRVPLETGTQQVTLKLDASGSGGGHKEEFEYEVEKGETIFQTYSALKFKSVFDL